MSANFSCYGEEDHRYARRRPFGEGRPPFQQGLRDLPGLLGVSILPHNGHVQNSIGSHHHRSGRGKNRIQLPDGISPIPVLFQKAGYFTCIGSGLEGFDFRSMPTTRNKRGKTDYNFDWNVNMYDGHDWANRKSGQPFFMQVQLHGGKLRGASQTGYRALEKRMKNQFGMQPTPHEKISLPPYYPKDLIILQDWATYLDTVRYQVRPTSHAKARKGRYHEIP